jgi:hypothetical protein
MSRDYNFFVECLVEGAWMCAPTLVRDGGQTAPFAKSLFHIPYRSPLAGVFFNQGSLIEFHRGTPPSPLSREVLFRVDGGCDDIWWMDFSDLMFDEWSCSFVIVSADVDQRYVSCFGDGDGLFPEEALKEKGMDLDNLNALRDCLSAISLVEQPIDRGLEFYRDAYGNKVKITWRKSISGLFEADVLEKIRNLRNMYGEDELRFVVGWG